MFGHQDEDQDQVNAGLVTATPTTANASDDNSALGDEPTENSAAYLDNITSETVGPDSSDTNDTPMEDDIKTADPQVANADSPSDDTSVNHRDDNTNLANNDLLDIKKQALDELSPLVDHLDQTPEEKFKTTMMMIQANDNQSLIPEAYKAAKDIGDEKARARALLDIVNEINYFTHKD